MASRLARSFGLASKSLRTVHSSQRILARTLATQAVTIEQGAPVGRRTKSALEDDLDEDDLFDLLTEQENVADSPALGHLILEQKREVLHYMRLIEHEMPKLVAYRRPFIPPNSKETPLVTRSIKYIGEDHPASAKRVIVVAVDSLPLHDEKAVHAFKLLAGPRWTPNPPKDAGVCEHDTWGNGYFKISCDQHPHPVMNFKQAADSLKRLIAAANEKGKAFHDLPVDLRHVYAKSRKAKKGDHLGDRPLNPVSIKDFPKEWLPAPPAQ
ncbi:mitochondrial ribosomal subunit protein-domain-containing protein [Coprinopsis sp. MPI-PUGE-AT-0042]|nr:mitochondrial ribosomal subunit protein-domain-containing protein [Coprinopsis sp. MPI-PUGE-AT-0042]